MLSCCIRLGQQYASRDMLGHFHHDEWIANDKTDDPARNQVCLDTQVR